MLSNYLIRNRKEQSGAQHSRHTFAPSQYQGMKIKGFCPRSREKVILSSIQFPSTVPVTVLTPDSLDSCLSPISSFEVLALLCFGAYLCVGTEPRNYSFHVSTLFFESITKIPIVSIFFASFAETDLLVLHQNVVDIASSPLSSKNPKGSKIMYPQADI